MDSFASCPASRNVDSHNVFIDVQGADLRGIIKCRIVPCPAIAQTLRIEARFVIIEFSGKAADSGPPCLLRQFAQSVKIKQGIAGAAQNQIAAQDAASV